MCAPARSLLLPALLFSVAFPFSSHGQTAPAADPFAAESFVIQHESSVYSYNADGTGYRESTLAVTIQSEAALRTFGVVAVGFAANSEKVELHYVRVRRRDGSVVETPLSQAIEQPEEVTREAPFYSDLKQEQIPVKSLGVGDTLEWQARVVRTHAEAPGEFWGQESFVEPGSAIVREATLELRFPKSKAVTVWTDPKYLASEGGKPPSDTIAGDERVVRWTTSALKPTTGKDAEAEKEAKKKQRLTADQELDAEQGKLPSVAWTTFPNWAAVGAWYRGLEGDRMAPDAEIKSRVAELTAGKTTEEEKVRAVYGYASSQIRYIGVAFGVGRYQPHRADDVLSNQYGDCKDKETLLASMLAVLGLRADAVLIGSGIRFNSAVPSPAAFNHLILRTTVNGQAVWLDPTAEVAPYRMLVAPLRDHEALVVPDSGAAAVERTPSALPFAAAEEWTAVGSLNSSGISESHIVLTLRGDDELFMRAVLRQVPPASYNEFAQKFLQGLGYAGTASHAEFSRADETSTPLRLAFDYHRERGGDWDNHRIVPQIAPVALPVLDEKEPPVASIDLSTPRTEHSTAEMTLPEGWSAELPEAVHQKTAWATYDLTYRLTKNVLYTERTIQVLQRKVPAAEWQAYKKWQDAVGLGNESFIQLTHFTVPGKSKELPAPERISPKPESKAGKADSGSAQPSGPAASGGSISNPATSSQEAQKLIAEAMEATQHFDLASATSLLDRARAFSDTQRGLWAGYGYVAEQMGKPIEANTDCRKELALHADEFQMYGVIAETELQQHHRPEAEAALHSYLAADAAASAPALTLANMLLEDNKAAEAIEVASASAAHLDSADRYAPQIQLVLGRAQLKAGQRDAGDKTLTALMRSSDDPGMLNDAAYELADASLELPLDESSAKTAIEKLTAEAHSWTLDEAPSTLKARTSLLVATWDTMGWILYREGKPREAQPLIAAAWLNGQQAVVREHLTKVQGALGPGFAKSPEAIDLNKGDQASRTIPLGKSDGQNGVAEYRLLLANDRVERAEAVGTSPFPHGEEMLKSARLPHFLPPGSEAHLVRTAMLNCHGGVCELVFAP